MQKGIILKPFYYLTTLPFIIIGNFFLWLNILQLKNNIEICLKTIDKVQSEVPDLYVSYLIAAEDHRSKYHFGIDQIGIFRAIYQYILNYKRQGASTIEQQFVRVVTGDYSYTLKRKLREQILAVVIARKRNKNDIAKAYLTIAYYGYRQKGYDGIIEPLGNNFLLFPDTKIISLIARLKYPEPLNRNENWKIKINRRILYIKNRHIKYFNGQP